MTLTRRLVLALPLAFALPMPALAEQVYTSWGVAIDGTDPVAYFTEGRPVEGDRGISTEWNGAKWLFSTAENRDKFIANPEAYAPQYGGFCAWAVSQGYTASTVPEAWRIVDGKLYLNYSLNVQKQWEGDIPGNITKADTNWPGLK
jgi:YHS domain-containing protein